MENKRVKRPSIWAVGGGKGGVGKSFIVSSLASALARKGNKTVLVDADIVLLDLGAGTSKNIIDSYLLADKKIIVTLPEITAIENLYSFLQQAFFRELGRAFVGIYTRGYVMSFAKHLGIDPQKAANDYMQGYNEWSQVNKDCNL